MNKTIERFVKEFEASFENIFQGQLTVCIGRKKYSDWDLKSWFKQEEISLNNIKQIDKFIRDFSDFSHVGLFFTFSPEFTRIEQHIDRAQLLQFMAFMPNESFAPFFDINLIGNLGKTLLTQLYGGKGDSEFLKWAIITGARKIKNNHTE